MSSATTRSRPIINTRDEPHADAERYRRLHVIAGDSNMSEYATNVKVGTVVALLQMIERDAVFRDLSLENPIRAIREIAHDLTCRRKVRLANGRELSALDIQWEYFDRVVRFSRNPGFPTEVQSCSRSLGASPHRSREGPAVTRPRGRLGDQIPSARALPRATLSCRSRTHAWPCSTSPITMSTAARGIYNLLLRQDMVDRVVDESEIQEAKDLAPQTTRARLRGEFIKAAKAKRRDFTVDWVHLKLNDQAQRTVFCKDPFKAFDDRVDRLIESL